MNPTIPSVTLVITLLATGLLPFALNADPKSNPASWRGQSITEFDEAESDDLDWEIVNDGVMGGLSKGKIEITEAGTMQFSGNLSLKNNGGFSTVRSKDIRLNLSNDLGLLLLVKGDGRTYQARVATDAKFRSMEVSFMGEFQTTKGKWQQVEIPFSDFKGSFRGMDLKDQKLDPSKIRRVGILLGDKKEGPFDLEIDWIRTYGKGQGELTSTQSGPTDLVQTVVADGRFKTLAAALTEAELVDVLQGKDALTVFAPTDEAFAKIPAKVLTDLLLPENREKLISILTYHVSSGASLVGDALKAGDVKTVQGATVAVAFSKGKVRVNDAALIDGDLEASNGIIHVIDSVLLPPEPELPQRKTILSVAEGAGSFSTLLAAISAAGLESVLESDGPFTVFAPTEEAFAALPKGTVENLLKKENRKQLADLLSYHVVPGRITAGDALNAGTAKSVQGAPLEFAISDGYLRVNDSTIRTADLNGGNGIIHVIDSVLLPPKSEAKGQTGTACGSDCDDPVNAIFTAIDKGVPLFNSGDPAGCATVYQDCLKKLSTNEDIDNHIRRMLVIAMERSQGHDDISRAWLFGTALDGMMAYLVRQQS